MSKQVDSFPPQGRALQETSLSCSNRLLGREHQLPHWQAFLGVQSSKFACSILLLEVDSIGCVWLYTHT